MSFLKYGFKKRDFLYGGIITAIIVVISLLLSIIGLNTDVFDPIGQAIDSFHLSDGFFYSRTKHHTSSEEVNPGIVIVDIQDCDSREEIASIVNKINQAGPKVLAVDIIFGNYASASSYEDSVLVATFKESSNLILSQRNIFGENGWHTERSFFANEVACKEGDVSFNPGMVRSFYKSLDVDGKLIPSFVSLIATEAGIMSSSGESLINYSPIKTITLGPNAINEDLIKDQIIILGDAGDLRDFHSIPVLIDGLPRASGVIIIAQCLYTLQPHNSFYTCPEWLSLIIGLILTYLFCSFIAAPMFRKEKFNGLWISIWQIVVLFFLLILTYILFWGFHFNMSLTYWVVGVGLSELATELFYFVKPKKF